jgi:hypothetical protein
MPRVKKAVFSKAELQAMRRSRSLHEVPDVEIDEEPDDEAEYLFDEDEDNLPREPVAARTAAPRRKRAVPARGRKPQEAPTPKRGPGRKAAEVVEAPLRRGPAKKTEIAPRRKRRTKAEMEAARKAARNGDGMPQTVDYLRTIRAKRIAAAYELPPEAVANIARTFSDQQLMDAERQLFSGVTEPQAYDRRLIDRDVGEVGWTRDGTGGVELAGVQSPGDRMTKENVAAMFSQMEARHEVLANKYRTLEQVVQELYSHFKTQNQGRVYGA